jgi:hypothetical protein
MKRRIHAFAGGLLVALTLSALTAGCSSSSPAPTLMLGSLSAPAMVGDAAPPSGRYFAQVPVTLTNASETPISGWWYYYEAATEKGLALSAAAEASTAVAMPCSSDTELYPVPPVSSASFTCNLIFEVPCGDTPVAIIYGGDGRVSATVSLPLTPGC